ncbi:MAG: response regulator [Verrucomicrobia bacterium]|nr:response regulator [Verrucomicrobiota bacterium]
METSIKQASAESGQSSGPLIFIVEDDGAIGSMLCTALKERGFQAQAFKSAETALGAFVTAEPRPALLVTDYDLPGKHGLELLQSCKKIEPALKCIVASGVITSEACQRYDHKPDAILKKPFFLTELLAQIDDVMKS